MRIALLSNGIYPQVVGGIQKHSYQLAKSLAGKGVPVDLYYALPPDADAPQTPVFTGEERHLITTTTVRRSTLPYFPGHYIVESRRTSASLLEALKAGPDVDFVYAQGFTGWKAIREKKRGLDLAPVGANPHGLEMYQQCASTTSKLKKFPLRAPMRWLLRNANVALSLGGGITDIVRSLGVPDSRIVESPNGIAESWLVDDIEDGVRPVRFVFVGRYERRKGVEELHYAIQQLLSDYDFAFDFVGPIPSNVRVQSPRLNYWGLVKDEQQIKAILRESDVLVCPSYSEGMPTVILEAMASGMAVIATDVGAVDMQVSNENGWLIPPGDQESLKRAMINAMTTPRKVLTEKKRKSHSCVEKRFVWSAVAEKTIEGIQSFLETNA